MPAGVPMGAINTLDAVVAHPQVAARDALVESTHPVAGTVRDDGAAGADVGDARARAHAGAAARRAHGRSAARAPRAGDEEIARLRRAGVIRN